MARPDAASITVVPRMTSGDAADWACNAPVPTQMDKATTGSKKARGVMNMMGGGSLT
ncbi:MAG: hypothetical protein ABIT38_05915 [Gemmatimonadaceae bacterium]